jgi:hypothetical protein
MEQFDGVQLMRETDVIIMPDEFVTKFYTTAKAISKILQSIPREFHAEMTLTIEPKPYCSTLVQTSYDVLRVALTVTEDLSIRWMEEILGMFRKIQFLNGLIGSVAASDIRPSISVGQFRDGRWWFGYALMKRIPEPRDPAREAAKAAIEKHTEQAVADFVSAGRELPPHGPAEPWVNAANARDTGR